MVNSYRYRCGFFLCQYKLCMNILTLWWQGQICLYVILPNSLDFMAKPKLWIASPSSVSHDVFRNKAPSSLTTPHLFSVIMASRSMIRLGAPGLDTEDRTVLRMWLSRWSLCVAASSSRTSSSLSSTRPRTSPSRAWHCVVMEEEVNG